MAEGRKATWSGGARVIRLSKRPKHRPKLTSPARNETAMPLAEEYVGKISRERAIEMLEHAIRHIWRVSPDSWANSGITLLTEQSLSRALNSIRPNIREVELPRPYPDQPGNSWRRNLYIDSLSEAAEVVDEILDTAGAECGEDFRETLKGRIVKRFRRKSMTHLATPDKKVNLQMIDVLRRISARCTDHPVQLKALASEGKDPGKWAQNVGVRLNRFCKRVYRVWLQLGSPPPPLEKILFIPRAQGDFLSKCSLMFPRDLSVAQEAIERAKKLSCNSKLNKRLSSISKKSRRPR